MKKNMTTNLHFYQGGHLGLELQTPNSRAIFRSTDQSMAELQVQDGRKNTKLLATDQPGSILQVKTNQSIQRPLIYSVFGYCPTENDDLSLLGFNGEHRNLLTNCYLLGDGYRAYSPILMRFHSPDSESPFGDGGLNSYTYCGGDPVNFTDPTGHMRAYLNRRMTLGASNLKKQSLHQHKKNITHLRSENISKQKHEKKVSELYKANTKKLKGLSKIEKRIASLTPDLSIKAESLHRAEKHTAQANESEAFAIAYAEKANLIKAQIQALNRELAHQNKLLALASPQDENMRTRQHGTNISVKGAHVAL